MVKPRKTSGRFLTKTKAMSKCIKYQKHSKRILIRWHGYSIDEPKNVHIDD